MDLANDERIRRLNALIQTEQNPQKLFKLVDELSRLLDQNRSAALKPPHGQSLGACESRQLRRDHQQIDG